MITILRVKVVRNGLKFQGFQSVCSHPSVRYLLAMCIKKKDRRRKHTFVMSLCVHVCLLSGNSTLHLAVQHELTDVLEKLLQKNVCTSMCDSDGYTPLQVSKL